MSNPRKWDRKIREKWLEIMPNWDSNESDGVGSYEWLIAGKNQGKRISQVHELHLENLVLEEQIEKLDNMFSFGIYKHSPHEVSKKLKSEKNNLQTEMNEKQNQEALL